MLLAYFSSYLTKHSTYGLAKNVSFDLNIVAKIKIWVNEDFNKYLFSLNKGLSDIKS